MDDRATTVAEGRSPEHREAPMEFEAFFRVHYRPLFGALRLLTRDGDEAEEVMQDAFLKVLERWERIRDLEDPTGYLYRTAMNVWRSRRRRLTVALRRTVRPRPAPDELALVEEREVVARALRPLTPGQRGAVVLVDVLGMTSEEAGEALGIAGSTVRVLVARGREVLRKEMNRDG